MRELTRAAKELGHRLGFGLVAAAPALPLEEDRKRYQEWCQAGNAASLAYMVREFPRRWTPQDLLPEARSLVTFGAVYFSGAPKIEPRRGYGRVARYAWGSDYHEILRPRLEEWVREMGKLAGEGFKAKVLVDSSPILERAYARESGLGFIGKNTLLIHRKWGSYLFLAEALVNLDLEPDPPEPERPGRDACGACVRCLADCPTGALTAPRTLDARKCIAYWTIEHRGGIPEDFRPRIGDWVFGCDVCQEVCPYNARPPQGGWREFEPVNGPHLDLLEVLALRRDEDFKKRFAGSPILRAKRAGLIRNACVVAANQKFSEAAPLLSELARSEPDPVARAHAEWALKNLE